jgi:O-methyltransferase involved in polyketide biosynthesis
MPEEILPGSKSKIAEGWLPTEIDTKTAHIARVYDFFLGGKDNFPADREAAALILKGNPGMRDTCREQREYLRRAVRHLTRLGIRQFVDIGTGLPTQENTHEVAQAIAPETRVAYIDNDPIVLAHARVLMADRHHGRTVFIHADARDPERLLADPALVDLIDFEEPVAVLLVGLLHFLPDHEQPAKHLRTLMDACPAGSVLALTHGATDLAVDLASATAAALRQSAIPCQARSRDEVLELLGDLEPMEPGLVPMAEWRPRAAVTKAVRQRQIAYGVVARKR